MSKIDVFNQAAAVVKSIELNDAVFGIVPNQQAIYDTILAYQAGLRQGTHSTKTRAFVSGTGKKPFRQKGTGRARQGSTRATQWRGGAIAFGPLPRKYNLKMNRKVRRLALRSGLTLKANNQNLICVENIEMPAIKTKDFVKVLNDLGIDRKALFVVDYEEAFDNAYMSLRNLNNVVMTSVEGLNIYDLQNANKLVMTKAAAARIGEVLGNE